MIGEVAKVVAEKMTQQVPELRSTLTKDLIIPPAVAVGLRVMSNEHY